MNLRAAAALVLAFAAVAARAADLLVPSQYSAIQFAIDAANDGDRVMVSPGIYSGNANTNLDFRGKNISVIGVTGRMGCVIDCRSIGRAVNFHSNEKGTALFKGFTVRDGSTIQGGAICIENSSPSITNCAFEYCHAEAGGAVCILSGSPSIRVCEFSHNDATSGGAIAVLGGHPSILTTSVADNHAEGFGGGVAVLGGVVDIHRSRFFGNDATSFGGALYAGDCSLTLAETHVQENHATSGGGLYLAANSIVSVLNSTVVVNRAMADVGGISLQAGCQATMANCIVARNSPTQMSPGVKMTTSFVEGGYSGQAVDQVPSLEDLTALDAHLRFGSGVDTGTKASITLEAVDLDGNSRVVGLAPDLGAFEYTAVASSASPDVTVIVPHDGDPKTDSVQVSLSGSASDPTGQAMTYEWLEDGDHIGSGQNLSITLKAGAYDFTFKSTAADGTFTSKSSHVVVNPEPNNPPTVSANILSFLRVGASTATVTMQAVANDPDHDPVSILWSDGSTDYAHSVDLLVGSYDYTVTATDSYGATSTARLRVQVDPVQGPFISLLGTNPMHVEAGGSFTDPGAIAFDADDSAKLTIKVTGTVDPSTIGTYLLTYSATSPTSLFTTIVRTVIVSDTTSPVVTLLGAASMTIPPNSTFVDPGATASDSFAGILPVTESGTIDTSKHATYVLTYSATDPSGNIGKAVRNVRVANTANPIVTLNGANPMYVQIGSAFIDPGATALSQGNEPLTVSVSGTVDTITLGTYTLTYSATDADGNTGSTTRTVIVWDKVAPVITINGDNPLSMAVQLAAYSDPGATAVDAVDGTVPVSVSGTVDTHTVGTYTITYTATDSSGNQSTATRTVNVTKPTTLPTITVNGTNPIEVDKGTTYVDAGATAVDLLGNSLTVLSLGTVDTTTYGAYTITYTATDQWGNTATATRTVNVMGKPVITIIGKVPIDIWLYQPFVDPGYSAVDYLGNPLTVTFTSDININVVGTYHVRYTATDQWGNTTTKIRVVRVNAQPTPPTITILGSNPTTVVYQGTYTEVGATAVDILGTSLAVTTTGSVNTALPGTYTITYKATDMWFNVGTATRTVTVSGPTTPPTITVTGINPITVAWNTVYSDAGATAKDALGNSVTVVTTNPVNTALPGTYTVTYNATDQWGNVATAKTRTVTVSNPTAPPTITVTGTNPVTVAWNSVYADAGATAKDVLNNSVTVTSSGSVNTAVPGTYTITYNATDQWGNVATPKTRTVTVSNPTTPPTITVLGTNPITVAWNSAYSDAGASAVDVMGNSVAVTTTGSVNTAVPGTYTLTYHATDQWGNVAATKTRTVIVSGPTTPPVITVLGTNPITVSWNSAYTDAGATAVDALGNSVTVSTTGSVNTASPGTYTLTYHATDQWGNVAATKTRTVTVSNPTTPPTITMLGSSPVIVKQGVAYTDAGATAVDVLGNSVTVVTSGSVNTAVAGTYTLTYNATDQWGNVAVAKTRTVKVYAPPVITLVGPNPQNLVHNNGTTWTDPGSSAVDSFGVSLTVTVTGGGFKEKVGTYIVTYTATDAAGNTTTVTRTVNCT